MGKKLKPDKQNWMEQQCTEVEEALKRNRIQELNNKVKLVSGTLQLRVASIKDTTGKILADNASIQKTIVATLILNDTHNDPMALTDLPINNVH